MTERITPLLPHHGRGGCPLAKALPHEGRGLLEMSTPDITRLWGKSRAGMNEKHPLMEKLVAHHFVHAPDAQIKLVRTIQQAADASGHDFMCQWSVVKAHTITGKSVGL